MILNLILLLAIPAAFVLGGLAAVEIMCRIDCGVAIDGDDDKSFIDEWEQATTLQPETPFSIKDEQHVQEALALVRPKPYPPLRAVE